MGDAVEVMLLLLALLPLFLTGGSVSAYPRGDGDVLNPLDDEMPLTMSIPVEADSTDPPSTETPEPIEHYQVLKVEFTRVETPFIIGIWIVCASLAKIGELSFVYFKYIKFMIVI